MEKKYTALRIIGTLYKIFGVLIALGTVLLVVLAIAGVSASSQYLRGTNLGSFEMIIAVIVILVSGALSALGVYAIGEALYLLIGLEENTRYTAMLMRDRFYAPQQVQPQPVIPQQMPPTYPPTA